MEHEKHRETASKTTQKTVAQSIAAFFSNPDNYDRIVLSARCRAETLARRLDELAAAIVRTDQELEDVHERTTRTLEKIARGAVDEDVGISLLEELYGRQVKLRAARSELEAQEAVLCVEAASIDRFEASNVWCRVHAEQSDVREPVECLSAVIERVDIYLKWPEETKAC